MKLRGEGAESILQGGGARETNPHLFSEFSLFLLQNSDFFSTITSFFILTFSQNSENL